MHLATFSSRLPIVPGKAFFIASTIPFVFKHLVDTFWKVELPLFVPINFQPCFIFHFIQPLQIFVQIFWLVHTKIVTWPIATCIVKWGLYFSDAKRLIGRKFDDAGVQSDMKHWPFDVVSDGGKPKIQVQYKGEDKKFYPEEISSMVLTKMKETADSYLGKVSYCMELLYIYIYISGKHAYFKPLPIVVEIYRIVSGSKYTFCILEISCNI